ncbi:MAG TPA: zf-HC2 domain-containing protein [Thermoanaerobaculia bacterium]|jgi:tetratricopeptide (TPR) repeat protein|nr:zf-HC2 domain-containing protein [Thermoanaerobaculia bacterium]
MLLAHPEAEDLGRFVEGTLDEPERASIIQHIADCDDCRMSVVDAAEFTEPAAAQLNRNWWMGIAAALILVAAIGTLTYQRFHVRLGDVKQEYAKVKNRPLEARLSGFDYVPHVVKRGGDDDDHDTQLDVMKGKAAELMELQGTDAKTLHARGIGFLLAADDPKKSIPDLQAAAERDPNNATYQNDLAAAMIAAGSNNPAILQRALAACDRALHIDSRSPDALFNRAVVLQDLGRDAEALAAYEQYLKVDSTSSWAAEARQHISDLRPLS